MIYITSKGGAIVKGSNLSKILTKTEISRLIRIQRNIKLEPSPTEKLVNRRALHERTLYRWQKLMNIGEQIRKEIKHKIPSTRLDDVVEPAYMSKIM